MGLKSYEQQSDSYRKPTPKFLIRRQTLVNLKGFKRNALLRRELVTVIAFVTAFRIVRISRIVSGRVKSTGTESVRPFFYGLAQFYDPIWFIVDLVCDVFARRVGANRCAGSGS